MELSRGLGMDSKVYGTAFRRGLKSGRGKQYKAFKTNKQEKRNYRLRSILLFMPILTEHILLSW
jgi:hypothetical protein